MPLQEGGGNQEANVDLICRSCHQLKTNDEAFRGNVHHLQSRFAPAEYKAYVESHKVLPIVFQVHIPPDQRILSPSSHPLTPSRISREPSGI